MEPDVEMIYARWHECDHSSGTVASSSSVTRRVLAEIVYILTVISYEVWVVFAMEYTLKD